MDWLGFQTTLIDVAIYAIEFALNWLLQSTVLLGFGLTLGGLLRRQGSALQSVIYRTTLVAVLICPLATWGLSQTGVSGWSVELPRDSGRRRSDTEVAEVDQLAPATVAESTNHPVLTPTNPTVESSTDTNVRFAESLPSKDLRPTRFDGRQATEASSVVSKLPAEVLLESSIASLSSSVLSLIVSGVAVIWLLVTGVLSARLATAWRQLAGVRKRAEEADEGTLRTCQEIASALKVSTPEVLRSPLLPSPCLAGLRSPAILLPESDYALSIHEVLIHELAHLRRNDCHWNLLRQIASGVFFFQPLLWALSRRLEATAEEVCDDYVVLLGGDRHEYAHRLVDIAELSSVPLAAAGVGIVSLRSMLANRVNRILDNSRPLSTSASNLLVIAAIACGVIGTTATGFVGLSPRPVQAATPPRCETPGIGDEPDAEEKSIAKRNQDWPRNFRLNIVGPNGNPVPNAEVEIRTTPKLSANQIHHGKFVRTSNYGTFATTDVRGRLTLTLPQRPQRFNLSIKQPSYGPYWAGWDSTAHPVDIPQEFTAKLDAGWSVGGVIVDDSGQPIAGVRVAPSIEYKKRAGANDQLGVGTRILTDSEGKWRFDSVPVSMSEVSVEVNHTGFQPSGRCLPRNGFEIQLGEAPAARIELQQGLAVTGIVTDQAGQPISGALLRTKFLNDIREARTNDKGEYRLIGCEPRMARIVASAKSMATDMQEVRVNAGMDAVNFAMKPGGKIRVRVVDEQGKGIPKARIFFQRWRGKYNYFEFDHVSGYADENGIWEWNEAPFDEIQADICRPGGMQLSRQRLVAREEEYVFKTPRALVVSGSVIDAKTKQPIQSFRVIPGLRNSDPRIGMNWIPSDSYEGSDGEYRIRLTHAYPAHLVRIEAEGYKVAISRDIMTDAGAVDYDFELHEAEDIAATVLAATGEPAANAKIALGVSGSHISIGGGDINDGATYATKLRSDEGGCFSIPARDEPFQLVITHAAGFAHLRSADGPIPNRIKLSPWARTEGTFRVGTEPAPNVVLSLNSGISSHNNGMPNIFTGHDATTGKDGRFVFERVFPGKGRIGRRIFLTVNDGATEVTSSQMVAAEFISGKTTQIDLGGKGRPVIGKLVPPDDYSEKVLWNFALVTVEADLKQPSAPAAPADVLDDPEKHKLWWKEWNSTDEGKVWRSAYNSYQQQRSESPYLTASLDDDGFFRMDDVLSGDYVLRVRFSDKAAGVLSGYRFSVPALDIEYVAEPLDLGLLKLDKQ